MSTVHEVEMRQGGTFPVLLEVAREESLFVQGAADKEFPDGHPSEVYLGRYHSGSAADCDRIELVRPIANTGGNELGPLWAPGGTIAFVSDWSGHRCLYQHVAGDPPKLVVDADIVTARYSPDGDVLAYVTQGPAFKRELWQVRPGAAQPQKVETGGGQPSDLAFLSDGRSVVCHLSSGRSGDGLFKIGLVDGTVERLVCGSACEPALSPDGSTLVYLKESDEDDQGDELWSFDMRTGQQTRLARSGPGVDRLHQPAFSPDGQRVLVTGTYTTTEYCAATAWVIARGGGEGHLHEVGVANQDVLAVVPQGSGAVARSHRAPGR